MSASLASLQRRLLATFMDGAALADAVEPADAPDMYRACIASNQRAALASSYPVVERLVGAPFFAEAARAYARVHPSVSGDLHPFGSGFAGFLRGYAPADSLDYLPDVARLEWAVHESAHAADAAPFDFASLAARAESEHGALRVRLAPSVRMLCSVHPVVAIWEANQPHRDGTPEALMQPDRVLIRREALAAVVERLDPGAWDLLSALAERKPLEEAAEALGTEQHRLPGLLAAWTSSGVIAALEPDAANA